MHALRDLLYLFCAQFNLNTMLVGRVIVVHEGKDDLGTSEKRQDGGSGPGVACGVIECHSGEKEEEKEGTEKKEREEKKEKKGGKKDEMDKLREKVR